MVGNYAELSDEALAARCAEGIDGAERELLRRHMQAIYWLPVRQFGADEDDKGDFLIFALEKLRERNSLAQFDVERGVRFTTWFGVVIRNLYLDYLRTQRHVPSLVELEEQEVCAAPAAPPPTAAEERADALLGRMSVKCRAFFKLLLANVFFLKPDEMRWIAETSGRSIVEVSTLLAELEEDLREADAQIEARRRQLDAVFWWKRLYERQLRDLERERELPANERRARLERTYARLERRRQQHERLLGELSGGAGLATTPYRRLAEVLAMKEGTLGSHITRCRQAIARLLWEEERGVGEA